MDTVAVVNALAREQRLLWVLAIVFYGAGDVLTTLTGLSVGGVAEGGPIAGPVMSEFGRAAFLLVKGGTFLACYACWAILQTPGRVAVPLALTVVGVLVTSWNGAVILLALLA